MNVLDLFSGIGGFSLGLERAGMRTVAFCEIDPYCQAVLRKHWPDVPVYGDVRELTAAKLMADAVCQRSQGQIGTKLCGVQSREHQSIGGSNRIDVIAGGFPCQDISVAGKGAGIGGERSGLWSEYARIIGEVRPRYVIVENVAALLIRGMGRVLGDLSALGYDAEWSVISAADVGAPHLRRRVWIVAYPNGGDGHRRRRDVQMGWGWRPREIAADHDFGGTQRGFKSRLGELVNGLRPEMDGGLNAAQLGSEESSTAGDLSDGQDLRAMRIDPSATAASQRLQHADSSANPLSGLSCESGSAGWASASEATETMHRLRQEFFAQPQQEPQHVRPILSFDNWQMECEQAMAWWAVEPEIPRVAKGVKDRVSRLRALGNAVVPQIPEIIGHAIMSREHP